MSNSATALPHPLLATKLNVPPPRANVVARARLFERLTDARVGGQKIILISAPAGFGKTTLIGEWCRAQSSATAWVALDAADNDPARFFAYLIAALNNFAPAIFAPLAAVTADARTSPETRTAQILNALQAAPDSLCIVLDDYHLIENAALHNATEILAAQAPPHVTLILTTRSDPPLPLARWRARGLLAEIRADDLRFAPDETAAFLRRAANLNLTARDVAALDERTEGWIAGLQLAALALQRASDPQAFITAFTGSHRFVLDYLVQEVLLQQSEIVQTFLLQTSILERLNADLCAAVLDDSEIGASISSPQSPISNLQSPVSNLLTELERANLFLLPLDETRTWYRYHHLFADVLRNRLAQTDVARVTRLHQRASDWFAQHGFLNEAIEHTLAAHDFARGADLLTAHLDEWMKRGEYVSLGKWLDALPSEFLTVQTRLGLARAATLISAHHLDAAEQLLDALDPTLSNPPPEQRGVRGELLAQRAALAHFRNHPERTIELANAALAELPPNLTRVRTATRFYLGLAYGITNQLAGMQETMLQVAHDSRANGDWYHALYAEFQLGALYFALGQLQRAIATLREAIAFADAQRAADLMVVGWLYSELGGALYEANELTEAEAMLERALGYALRGAMPRMQAVVLMRQIETARGARDEAKHAQMLAQAEALIREYQLPPRYSGMIQARRVEWWLETAQLATARAWAREFQSTLGDVIDYVREDESAALARVRLAEGDPDAALEILDRLCANTAATQRLGSALSFQILRACAHAARGENQRALELLSEQLTWSAPEKYTRVFVDEGVKAEPLLRALYTKLRHAPQRPAYFSHLETILAAFPRREVTEPPAARSLSPKSAALIEPLAPREMQMLELIAQGYTEREIAARLHISSATVKKHLANLFGKLDVHSRTQAIARAKEIELL